MSKLRVFVVDDHPVVRNGLKTLVADEADMEVVGEAYDGQAAVRLACELRPDVVVMDLSMPGMGGVEAAAQIHKGCPEVRVVALTAHEDRGYLRQVIAAGATGYVLKRAAGADLVRAIRHAAAGNTYLDPSVAGQIISDAGQLTESGRPELSEREAEVVRQIAQGFSNKQIAAKLGLSVKTVETYKTRSLEKLGLHSRVDIVRYAAQRGWLTGEWTWTGTRPSGGS